ncbi:MAG: HlyD family type I secretion periplasmic adaptor subunit [Hyphomicrobiaceae bacterium]|nr:HlyD family type I secretion periplasmic adaptor subunit [Hyphomicrobiaceae bacterium]
MTTAALEPGPMARLMALREAFRARVLEPVRARVRELMPPDQPERRGPETDLDEMIEEQPPKVLRKLSYVLAGALAAGVVGAAIVHIDIIVQSSGQLNIDVPPIVIQPMERSIVRSLNVKVGETVRKGQQLATLDATFAEADLAALRTRHRTLLAQVRRMEAEWSGGTFQVRDPSDADERLQAVLMRQRQSQLASRLKAYDEELNRFEASARTIDGQRETLAEQLAVVQEIEGMRSRLLKLQAGSRMQLLLARDTRLRAEREHRDAVDRLTELQFATSSKRAERQAFLDDWRRTLLEDLDRQRAELARTREQLTKAERMHDLIAVTAPEDGVVLDLAKRSVGSVLREAEPLMSIMPSGATLIAEILISSADIGYAKIGDEVLLKVDAFPFQKHGMLKGRLISIGEESFTPGGAQGIGDGSAPTLRQPTGVFHRARVEIVDLHLDNLPKGVRLLAGMTVAGEIKVGTRSVMSYFLYPITRGLRESIREP